MEEEKRIPIGWTLTYQEVSNNVYHMRLRNDRGPSVETTGVDFDQLLVWCIASARDIDDQRKPTTS